ncbi:MAG: cell division protein FtsA [Alphaproteobacteria bacterium]
MILKHIRQYRSKNTQSTNECIAALDIGTSKICCAIAHVDGPDYLRVVGVGHQLSRGIRAGNIIDMQEAELSVLNAVHLAEQMAKENISEVFVNIPLTRSQTISAELPISGHSIDDADIRRLMTMARQVEEPENQEPVLTIPTSYEIDGRRGIRDPRGMFGDNLGVDILTIFSGTNNLRNITTCVDRAHLNVKSFVATPLAAGFATLVDDEMDLGTIVIDMGAGTTTIGVFFEGNIVHSDCLSVGGLHVTNDIARILSTPVSQAERLKTLHGSVMTSTTDDRDIVKVPQIGELHTPPTNQIAKSDLVRIIRPRIEETFELIRKRLERAGIDKRVSNRVVLTGGGSQLPGLCDMAGAILDKQVRLGKPLQSQMLHKTMAGPAFSTCAGLLSYAHLERSEAIFTQQAIREPKTKIGKIGQWLKENV